MHKYCPKLSTIQYTNKTLFYTSPEGTGKTKCLIDSIISYLSEYPTHKVLVLIARVAVCNQLHSKFKSEVSDKNIMVVHYKNIDAESLKMCQVLISTPDSIVKLHSISGFNPDLLFIDEGETFIMHICDKLWNEETNSKITSMVRKVKSLVVFDIYQSPYVVKFLSATRKGPIEYLELKHRNHKVKIVFVKDKETLYSSLENALRDDKKCYVFSDLKKNVSKIAEYYRKVHGKRVLLAISDSEEKILSKEDEQALDEFQRDPKSNSPNYDLIASSPKFVVGIDITDCGFHKIFGLITSNITIPSQIFQALRRVRDPKDKSILVYMKADSKKTSDYIPGKEYLKMVTDEDQEKLSTTVGKAENENSINHKKYVLKDLTFFEKISIELNEERHDCRYMLKTKFERFLNQQNVKWLNSKDHLNLELQVKINKQKPEYSNDSKEVFNYFKKDMSPKEKRKKELIDKMMDIFYLKIRQIKDGKTICSKDYDEKKFNKFKQEHLSDFYNLFNRKLTKNSWPLNLLRTLLWQFNIVLVIRTKKENTFTMKLKSKVKKDFIESYDPKFNEYLEDTDRKNLMFYI